MDPSAIASSTDDSSQLSDNDYVLLAGLRAGMRNYLAWAEERAKVAGLTPAQVQLALAVRAHKDPIGPTITQLAAALQLRHHSAVGLIDRAELAGLVQRRKDSANASVVHVVLTDFGAEQLEGIGRQHLSWLAENGAELGKLWGAFEGK